MKKVALVLIAIAFASGVAFAQDQAAAPAKTETPAQQAKAVVGKLVNVTVAEPAKGIANGTVTITDDTGKAVEFTVTQSTKVLDATLNAITLNQLKIGEKVKVKSKEGTKEAAAIKVAE